MKNEQTVLLVQSIRQRCKKAIEQCQFTLAKKAPFTAQISPSEIYLYTSEEVILHSKCSLHGKTSSEAIKANGAIILTIGAGCKLHSKSYVFNRNKESFQETVEPILTSPMPSDIWSFLRYPGEQSEDLKEFL